jgi:hypothetical protein
VTNARLGAPLELPAQVSRIFLGDETLSAALEGLDRALKAGIMVPRRVFETRLVHGAQEVRIYPNSAKFAPPGGAR